MEPDELDGLYSEVVLDHRRNPRNRYRLEAADINADGVNPFCGDEVHLQVQLDGQGRVAQIGLQGQGCSINQAAGSMLTEVVRGKTLDEVEGLSQSFHRTMRGKGPSEERPSPVPALPGDLGALLGVRQFPVRIKCALLAWSTLEEGIEQYRRGHR